MWDAGSAARRSQRNVQATSWLEETEFVALGLGHHRPILGATLTEQSLPTASFGTSLCSVRCPSPFPNRVPRPRTDPTLDNLLCRASRRRCGGGRTGRFLWREQHLHPPNDKLIHLASSRNGCRAGQRGWRGVPRGTSRRTRVRGERGRYHHRHARRRRHVGSPAR